MITKPRRFGKPLTEAERRERHERLYPKTKFPPRGTGLKLKMAKKKKKRKKKVTPLGMMGGAVQVAVGTQAIKLIGKYT